MKSKEDLILEQFFNTPKYWHFYELLKKSKISKPQLAEWLKKFEKQGLIKRVKKRGKMPYYIGMHDNLDFRSKKRLFALKKLTNSGLITYLSALKNAKVVILFGSMSRWDWYDDSDVDIFIYGDYDKLNLGKYMLKLNKQIQVHDAKNRKDLKRIDKMLPYIIMGDFVKGSVEDLGVSLNA